MDTTKKDTILEGNELADKLLRQLPAEEQNEWLVGQLYEAAGEKEARQFVNALVKREVEKPAELRRILREFFEKFGFGETAYMAAADTYTVMLGKIIEGWNWRHVNEQGWIYPNQGPSQYYNKTHLKAEEDAEDCFLFFCQAIGYAGDNLKKNWISLLHKHINTHIFEGKWQWRAEDLDKWILEEKAPPEVKLALASARLRIGGAKLVQREIQLAKAFHANNRSPEAMKLALEYLRRLSGIEAVAEELWLRVRPANERGDPNQESPLGWLDEVRRRTESADVARLMIKFSEPASRPATIAKIQKLRDDLVGVYNQNEMYPIRILIAASGPDNFSYRED